MVRGLSALSVILVFKIVFSRARQLENNGLDKNQIIATPLVKIKKCCPNGQTYDKWYNCVDIEGRKLNISLHALYKAIKNADK